MTSVRKTSKTLVWKVQNRSIPSEICLENNHKIGRFFTDCFLARFAPKFPSEIPVKLVDFSANLFFPLNLLTYQKPCSNIQRLGSVGNNAFAPTLCFA